MKKKLIIILVVIFLILASCAGVFCFSNIKLKMNGDKELLVKLNEEFKDPGAEAKFLFWKIKDVKAESNVDTSKMGTYKVTYNTKFLYKKKSIERTVKVVDGEVPVLELKGADNLKIYVNGQYEEKGYTATDNIDGDITDKVVVTNNIDFATPGTYKVTYEVKDSSENKAYLERIVEVMERPATNCSGVPVLMYHFFYDETAGETMRDANWTEIHAFEEQVKYLIDAGYYFPTWQEMIDYVDGKIYLPEKSVVITADDGDISFFKYAAPVLQKYGVRGTSFVIGEYSNQDLMKANPGIDYESHTFKMHRGGCSGMGHGGLFQCIDHDAGVEDLKVSIEIVGDNKAIAYPFGDVNENVKTITRDAGIQLGFTTAWGKVRPGMDKWELPRIRVSGGISLNSFIDRL